jgi:hypothetical protein
MPTPTTPEDRRERIYAMLANAVDEVAPEQERLYLAKVALALALASDDPDMVSAILLRCRADL